jgi:hypothetical protein
MGIIVSKGAPHLTYSLRIVAYDPQPLCSPRSVVWLLPTARCGTFSGRKPFTLGGSWAKIFTKLYKNHLTK